MRSTTKRLGIAAAATVVATAGAGSTAFAAPGNGANEASTADIAVNGCVIESTKDISYLAFSGGGAGYVKDESVNATTVDLTAIDGIEAYDSVEVKAGTTVESFAIDCGDVADDGQGDGAGSEDEAPEDGTEDDASEDGTEDAAPEDGGTGQGELPGSGQASASSTAFVTVDECVVEASKDISYLAFYDAGDQVLKTEPDAETVDLTTVEDIESYEAVEVKAGTTVETFDIACGDPGSEDGSENGSDDGSGSGTDDGTDDGSGSGTDDGSGDGTADGMAVITLSGCVLESTKDISNIEFFADGASLWKDESMNTTSFDLTTVDGIDAVDTIAVKSGETVEEFAISCTPTGVTAV